MDEWQSKRLTDAELRALFDRLFPHGFAGPDVLDDIAPEGWDRSPLLACFHPSVERVLEERRAMHRHVASQRRSGRAGRDVPSEPPLPEPMLDDVRRTYESRLVKPDEGVTTPRDMCPSGFR